MLGHFGTILGPSGANLKLPRSESSRRYALLSPSWVVWGPLGANLAPSWAILTPSWGHLGAILGPSWGHLGASWDHLGAILGQLEPPPEPVRPRDRLSSAQSSPKTRPLEPILGRLGASWGQPGAILGPKIRPLDFTWFVLGLPGANLAPFWPILASRRPPQTAQIYQFSLVFLMILKNQSDTSLKYNQRLSWDEDGP